MKNPTDLLIIGGGINGVGIAADAAGRGLSVILCEQGDLASGTSSASTKLIHGGLRYLEHYNFALVRHSLQERSILLQSAPYLIEPLRFVIPLDAKQRPTWLVRLGLFLYDHLTLQKDFPSSELLNLTEHAYGSSLKAQWKTAGAYSDCKVDDARLVVVNAIQARNKGADIRVRHAFISAQRRQNDWQVQLKNRENNQLETLTCKVLINAAGPWVEQVRDGCINAKNPFKIAKIKGSHIVVPRLYEGEQAYLLQQPDGRIVFTIPYQTDYTLIGTTEEIYTDQLEKIAISADEITYLLATIQIYFKVDSSALPIIWSYAGVRPLLQSKTKTASALSRDYFLELNTDKQQAPLLNVYGGKLTTYRRLAEDALHKLAPYFPHCGPVWTAHARLPGATQLTNTADFKLFLQKKYPWLPLNLTHRYVHSYGDLCLSILADCTQLQDLGQDFGASLYEREVKYLVEQEWARTAEDILWRRSKLGLHCTKTTTLALENWLAQQKLNENIRFL